MEFDYAIDILNVEAKRLSKDLNISSSMTRHQKHEKEVQHRLYCQVRSAIRVLKEQGGE